MEKRAQLAGVRRDEKQTSHGMGGREMERGKEERMKDGQCMRYSEVTNVTKKERYERREIIVFPRGERK